MNICGGVTTTEISENERDYSECLLSNNRIKGRVDMIDITKEQREIVVYGTGLNAVKWVFDFEDKGKEIKYFLNTDSRMDTLCGKAVYSPGIGNLRNKFVVVAVSSVQIYLDISRKLQQYGLREFEDYIYYRWIDKQIVLIHGNCHMQIVRRFLESSKLFLREYVVYPNPAICDNKQGEINEAALKNCDILIHQEIRQENQFGYKFSDEYIRTKIKKGVFEIIVPNLFGLGKAFFPHSSVNSNNCLLRNGQDLSGMFPHADSVIDCGYKQGKKLEEIISFAKSNAAIDKNTVLQNFDIYMKKIKDREQTCDIKIYDYILEHYKNEKLFYDSGHPTNSIIRKYAVDILQMLGINDENIYSEVKLDMHEVPVYPVIKEYLGLEWKEENMRESSHAKKMRETMKLEEYIYEYLWWCYGYK